MFDLNELNSAASAIAGAYRLVSCACAIQHAPGTNGTILECEAILLKFRCYNQPDMIAPSSYEFFQDEIVSFDPACLPQQAVSILPIARGARQGQQEEEKLIWQIESALMSTIEDLSSSSDRGTAPSETNEIEDSPALLAGPFRLPKPSGERRSSRDVSQQLKLRNLQKPSAVDEDKKRPFFKTILNNSTRLLKWSI